MIIKGNPGGNVGFWSTHLLRDDTNERAEVVEISGLLAEDLPTALREMEAVASGSRSEGNFLYQANLSPRADEKLTAEQWKEAVDILEKNLGLEGHQRVVVEHEKEGRIHRHAVWNRVCVETLRVADMGGNWRIHTATARELEERFDLTPTPTPAALDRKPALELWEIRAAERSGIAPADIKAELTELWNAADSGKAFAAAIEERGYILAKGDRRDFCVIDQAGDAHSLARRLEGVRAKDVREGMADVDRDSLPTVAEARGMQREASRAAADLEKWQESKDSGLESVADAAAQIEKVPLAVIDTVTGVSEKLVDFVTDLLGSSHKPQPTTPAQFNQMDEIKAQRKALAAMENIRESIERGENLKSDDIEKLTHSHLESIRAKGDSYLLDMIERMERTRTLERDYGRERER
jgi:hypothetical protein